jgi:sulfur relay (sulfurtransferase) complex TusBCD TusD component (DsrE family)
LKRERSGKIIKNVAVGRGIIYEVINMKVNGKPIKCMGRARSLGQMAESTLESTRVINLMVKVPLLGLMVKST